MRLLFFFLPLACTISLTLIRNKYMRLSPHFFEQKAQTVAKGLLGKFLVREIDNQKISGMIVETEAYVGTHDLACHASKGKTNRTKVMFEKGGVWYVYFIYGMYFNLNVVAGKENCPTAVLIRAIEPAEGIEQMKINRKTEKIHNLTSGPGKLCQALSIDKSFYGASAFSDAKLYIEDRGINIPRSKIVKTKRVGVEYAKEWKDELLRFFIKDNPFVSKPWN